MYPEYIYFDKVMISIDLKGGLGNQLFQIMATVAHSIRTNIPFVFSREKFQDEGPNRPTYWATLFRHLEPYLNTHNQIDAKAIEAYKISYQNDRTYEPIPYPSVNMLLKGYYQDYRYFDDVYDQILEITGIPDVRNQVLAKHVAPSNGEITVSMHFRRGDYCGIQCYHPILNEYYYIRAMLSMLKYLQHDTTRPIEVVCFYEKGDREAIAKIIEAVRDITNGAGYSNVHYVVDRYQELADWEQLLVMSSCDHHIIANSTFSWWSAYLNPGPNKIVCYPNTWVGHQLYYIDTKGFQVPGWHCVPSFSPHEKICHC